MLGKKPDFNKYKGDSETLGNAFRAWDSTMFGGTVLQPTGKKPNGRRDKHNPLRYEIENLQVDYLYGGGFYNIKHIVEEPVTEGGEEQDQEAEYEGGEDFGQYGDEYQQPMDNFGQDDEEYAEGEAYGEEGEPAPPTYWDVEMLVDAVDNYDEIKVLKSKGSSDKMKSKKKKYDEEPEPSLNLDDIRDSLTGYGRIVKYELVDPEDDFKPNNCKIVQLLEGKFKKGMLDGYGRLVNAESGEVKVGFFKEDFLHGKGQQFTVGQDAADFEGMFEDDEGVKE